MYIIPKFFNFSIIYICLHVKIFLSECEAQT